jgi:hypothetical protein
MPSIETRQGFDYDLFRSLDGANLVRYMEPIVEDPAAMIPAAVLDRIATECLGYDESHLVYAIELGPNRDPDGFATVVISCLAHGSQAVRCAASRALNRLPDRLITRGFVDAARFALVHCPVDERRSWDNFLEGPDQRVRPG